jgi:uncharacterized membrane protein
VSEGSTSATRAPQGRGAFGVRPGRVVGADVARCLALVGMIATHSLASTTGDGGVTVVQQVAGGRASALFAVLAGVSLALMSGRTTPVRGTEARAVSAGLAVRALAVAALGLVLGAMPTSVLVILPYYGVLFLLGIPFLRFRAGTLALLGAGWVVVVPVLMHLLRMHLPEAPIQSPTPESLADPLQLLAQLTVTGTYPAVPWLGYLLVGMAVGRLDLSRWRTAVELVVVGSCLAAGSWSASYLLVNRPEVQDRLDATLTGPYAGYLDFALQHGLYGTTPTGTWWWLAVDAPHSGTPFDLAQTIGSALVVLGLSLLLGLALPRFAAVAFGAGAMTLTLYSLHLVLRLPAYLPGDDLGTFLRHVSVVLVVGALYRLAGRSGPLERVVTMLAQGAAARVRGGPDGPAGSTLPSAGSN